jgi:predicted DNA-binding protein
MYNTFMRVREKKGKPGRKPTGKTPLIALRLSADVTARLDAWAARKGLTRSEGVRRLIEVGLARSRSNAAAVASNHLDRHADPLASQDEQDRRKTRLLRGPEEFRDMIDKRRKLRK